MFISVLSEDLFQATDFLPFGVLGRHPLYVKVGHIQGHVSLPPSSLESSDRVFLGGWKDPRPMGSVSSNMHTCGRFYFLKMDTIISPILYALLEIYCFWCQEVECSFLTLEFGGLWLLVDYGL